MDSPRFIYRLCSAAQVDAARETGHLPWNADDERDGFQHFSTQEQVPGTAAKYYADTADLMLVAVPVDQVEPLLRWEISRNNTAFPHIYGRVPFAAIQFARPVPGAVGDRQFPAELFT